MHLLMQRLQLPDAINQWLYLLKLNLAYQESDELLAVASNLLCYGTSLERLEHRQHDEVFLNALVASRIPDPTASGDFFRRFGFLISRERSPAASSPCAECEHRR